MPPAEPAQPAEPAERPRKEPAADASLMRRCEELFAARGAGVRRLAQRLLGQDAADGVQEVFAATVASLPTFAGRAQLSTWFHGLAIRVLSRCRQRRDRDAARVGGAADLEAVIPAAVLRDYQASPFDRALQREQQRRLRDALEQLSPTLREVLVLRLENLSYAELAAALEIPVGTVKSRMAAAMVQLSIRLQEEPR